MPELLAPAGEPDSGYAALAYGADAVYLGLERFSARAEAVNFSPRDLAEFVVYAHSLRPARRVYLALNTLIKENEIPSAAATLLEAAECGVDAVIVQDWGVARLVRRHFPGLALHASTQMAIHSLEGALAAKRLGCARVTLARELTLDEVARIVAGVGPDLAIETFIHGTLCYSYSGLCLFSSMATGRSGNRGRCAYSCREAADTPFGRAHPFSLKDMALGERVLDLARVGVASLKIEGRKKSPLYVAATVDYYRRILDGVLRGEEAALAEARLKTIFARPWTTLFLDSKHNPAAADPLVVGHRGSPIGVVRGLRRTPAGRGVAFQPSLPVERHDGLQVDIPGEARPYGFPVDRLYLAGRGTLEEVFAVPAGASAMAALPPDAPEFAVGLPLYQASSQAVKRSYPFTRPKEGAFAPKQPVRVAIEVGAAEPDGTEAATATATCRMTLAAPEHWLAAAGPEAGAPLIATVEERVGVFPARDPSGAEKTARAAFERMGATRFVLGDWSFANAGNGFIRQGDWNRLRRDALEKLSLLYEKRLADVAERLAGRAIGAAPTPSLPPADGSAAGDPARLLRWSVYAETPDILGAFATEDFAAADEVVLEIADGDASRFDAALETLARAAGRDKIRLALPILMREEDAGRLAEQVDALWRAGWRLWQVAGLAGWRLFADRSGVDLAADWPLHTLNSLAAEQLAEMGFASFTLSPEDERDNLAHLLARYGDRARLVAYSALPLFISAACAHAHLGRCGNGPGAGGEKRCPNRREPMPIRLERSGKVEIYPSLCGSVVTADQDYTLAGKLSELARMGARHARVDFRWKRSRAEQAVALWRALVGGEPVSGSCGNIERGLL